MRKKLLLRAAFLLAVLLSFSLPSIAQQTNINQKSKNNNFLEEWYAGIGKAVSVKKYNGNEESQDTLSPGLRYGIQKTVDRPDEDYIAKTTRLDLSEIEDKMMVYSVEGDDFSITFDAPMKKQDPASWTEWGFLPDVEDENPHFLWGFYNKLELNLNKPVCVFGLEIATGYYGTFPITLELYNHSTLIGKITRNVKDVASLFAAEVPGEIPINRAVIKVPWDAYGIGIANIRYSDKCNMEPSGISGQPQSIAVCTGGSHTFMVNADGENPTYQWYKGNNKILGANKNTLTITNISDSDYDQYYVVIKDGASTSISNRVTLWVADPLPAIIKFAEFPELIAPNKSYLVKLAGYSDVTNYSWTYSGTNAKFLQKNTKANENTFVTTNLSIGGVLTVELEHVCGNRFGARTATFKSSTGKEDIQANTFQIYPNPTSDVIRISGCDSEVKLYNTSGVLLGTYQVNNGMVEISLSRFAKGVYFINCDGNTHKVIKK